MLRRDIWKFPLALRALAAPLRPAEMFPIALAGPEAAAARYRALPGIRLTSIQEAEAVIVATPMAQRGADAVSALRGGHHVLIEPPAAIAVEDVDRIIGEANRRNHRVGCVYPLRFARHCVRSREIVSSGELGPVNGIRLEAAEDLHRGLTGAALELLDLVRWILGEPIQTVAAPRHSQAEPAQPVRSLHLLATTVNSGPVSFVAIPEPGPIPDGGWSLSLSAQRGSMRLCGSGSLQIARAGRFIDETPSLGPESPLALLVSDFVEACRTGREPEINGVDAMAGVTLLLGATAASRLGQAVRLRRMPYEWDLDRAYELRKRNP